MKAFVSYIERLWDKTTQKSSFLTSKERLIFLILQFFEFFYCCAFKIVVQAKRRRSLGVSQCVISVGNISVGGTGKSVVVHYLVDLFDDRTVGVFLRGYRGNAEKSKQSLVVHDGISRKKLSVHECGDEAYVLSQQKCACVIVGRNRRSSYQALSAVRPDVSTIILDDAYQNVDLIKDIELVLLDARKPFENEHCLPAGRLREKDCSRANAFIMTHADRIDVECRMNIKNALRVQGYNQPVFWGKHEIRGIFLADEGVDVSAQLVLLRVAAFAGIGSPQGFEQTLTQAGLNPLFLRYFQDHYNYLANDLDELCKQAALAGVEALVTTSKDWCKIAPLYAALGSKLRLPIYVIRITLAWLSPEDENNFIEFLNKTALAAGKQIALRSPYKTT